MNRLPFHNFGRVRRPHTGEIRCVCVSAGAELDPAFRLRGEACHENPVDEAHPVIGRDGEEPGGYLDDVEIEGAALL